MQSILELPSYQDMQEMNQKLTDSGWKVIEKHHNDQRNRWHSWWKFVNAILLINRISAQWRDPDSKCPPWQSVYLYYLSSVQVERHLGAVA